MPDPTSTTDDTVVERTVDATPAETWPLWTGPDQFRQWYGPAGATIPTARFDLRAGGERVVAMAVQTPGGERTMWFRGRHLDIEEGRLLVYSETLTDEDGSPQSPETPCGSRWRTSATAVPSSGSPTTDCHPTRPAPPAGTWRSTSSPQP